MRRRCTERKCFVHEGESCALGEDAHTQCSSWLEGEEIDAESTTAPETPTSRVPWSGSALGLADLAALTPRARPIVIGVLGAHDAGKTTLLAGNYLQLLKGCTIADAHFAGSRTLGAWEALAAWTRFDDAARKPTFPPHTARGIDRVPGLLHLALRGLQDELRDVLIADAPGEWFSRWAVQEDAPDAEGARWVVQHADAFLVFADCQRLAAAERGQARRAVRELLERLGGSIGNRPVTLVWSKADHEPPEGIRSAIINTLEERIPTAQQKHARTDQPESLVHALEEVVRAAWWPTPTGEVIPPVLAHRPYAAFRGHHAYT